jgi:hypothetical protein
VLYRLYLAEKLKEPFRKGARRPDAALLAAREAAQLEVAEVGLAGFEMAAEPHSNFACSSMCMQTQADGSTGVTCPETSRRFDAAGKRLLPAKMHSNAFMG